MDSFDSHDPSDEALWRLLGRARAAEASPYFVRKVLREIESAPAPAGWWRFLLRTVAPAAVCASLAVMALLGSGTKPRTLASNSDLEFETIQNLDLLVSNYESSLWLAPSTSSR